MSNEKKPVNSGEKNGESEKDSFGNDVKKSPWLVYAMLQIPIVIIMVIILIVIYQYRQGMNDCDSLKKNTQEKDCT